MTRSVPNWCRPCSGNSGDSEKDFIYSRKAVLGASIIFLRPAARPGLALPGILDGDPLKEEHVAAG